MRNKQETLLFDRLMPSGNRSEALIYGLSEMSLSEIEAHVDQFLKGMIPPVGVKVYLTDNLNQGQTTATKINDDFALVERVEHLKLPPVIQPCSQIDWERTSVDLSSEKECFVFTRSVVSKFLKDVQITKDTQCTYIVQFIYGEYRIILKDYKNRSFSSFPEAILAALWYAESMSIKSEILRRTLTEVRDLHKSACKAMATRQSVNDLKLALQAQLGAIRIIDTALEEEFNQVPEDDKYYNINFLNGCSRYLNDWLMDLFEEV